MGDYFSGCILTDIASLQIYCGLHRKHYGYYRLLSKRFPYSIYYDVINDVTTIVAVLDMRMQSTSLRKIVSKRKTKKDNTELGIGRLAGSRQVLEVKDLALTTVRDDRYTYKQKIHPANRPRAGQPATAA